MIIFITSLTIFLISCFDMCFGNRLFPGQVGVIEHKKKYYMFKMHRIFLFFRAKLWLNYIWSSPEDHRAMDTFSGSFNGASVFHDKDTAIRYAQVYSNTSPKESMDAELVWSSKKQKRNVTVDEEELTIQLGDALRLDDLNKAKKIMEELKNYKYI